MKSLCVVEMTDAEYDVIAERARQISDEGYDQAHDDKHFDGSIARAAACYAFPEYDREYEVRREHGAHYAVPKHWPLSWHAKHWKPKTRREDLVRAGALIIAEIERLDRRDKRTAVPPRPTDKQKECPADCQRHINYSRKSECCDHQQCPHIRDGQDNILKYREALIHRAGNKNDPD